MPLSILHAPAHHFQEILASAMQDIQEIVSSGSRDCHLHWFKAGQWPLLLKILAVIDSLMQALWRYRNQASWGASNPHWSHSPQEEEEEEEEEEDDDDDDEGRDEVPQALGVKQLMVLPTSTPSSLQAYLSPCPSFPPALTLVPTSPPLHP